MNDHPNNSPAVENLQRYLRKLSFDEASIPAPPVDGIFDTRTEEALREFQRSRGLPVTGSSDQDTWEQLYADYRGSLALNSPPRQISAFPPDPFGYVMVPGSTGFAVAALQYMLRELHYHYLALRELPITAVYDEETSAAVRLFQEKNRLSVDGNVGLLTWNAIADQYNILFSRNND